jgi:hypothetical protein
MEAVRDKWTDERLDDLNAKVDVGFDRVDRRFDAVDRRFDAIDRRFEGIDKRIDRVYWAIIGGDLALAGMIAGLYAQL